MSQQLVYNSVGLRWPSKMGVASGYVRSNVANTFTGDLFGIEVKMFNFLLLYQTLSFLSEGSLLLCWHLSFPLMLIHPLVHCFVRN